MRRIRVSILVLVAAAAAAAGRAAQAGPPGEAPAARDLVGLWRARLDFGPEIEGPLVIERDGESWRAEIAGRSVPAEARNGALSFTLPDGQGAFRGKLANGRILGHWIQPKTVSGGGYPFASPVQLEPQRPGRWRGLVAPVRDAMTFYLPIRLGGDGRLETFLRNPERNAGRFLPVEHVSLEGRNVKLLGRRSRNAPETVLAEGPFDAENETFSISIPNRGGTFDFRRATAAGDTGFYPRGKVPARYVYRPPPAEDDGWPVARLEDVGISREGISRFVQILIDMPIDSFHASDIHAVLIARHGKLVLEEYFHGFHREEPHDTRSAAKTLVTLLTGAAHLKGLPIGAATPVYETMDGPDAARRLEARKRTMTVEHLLTMASGLECDDSIPDSPGHEDRMSDQTEQPDWHRFTLDLKSVRAPGEKAAYCSGSPNLAGGVLAKATGRWLPDLFQELIAEPLEMGRYGLNLMPTGEAYMGGGARIRPRDFLKLAQIMVDGGRWKGRPIISPDWARRSASPLYPLGEIRYGYLWWVVDFPYRGRTIQAFFAGGNGGQVSMGVPELDLVIAFHGGNYSDYEATLRSQRVLIPEHILPAVEESRRDRAGRRN